MNINKTTIETLSNHHKQLYPTLVNWLESNVKIENGLTASQNLYNYLYSNWNVLGPKTKIPQKQSTYIDYIVMVIFNNDPIGYVLENRIMNSREDKFTKFYNRLHKELTK